MADSIREALEAAMKSSTSEQDTGGPQDPPAPQSEPAPEPKSEPKAEAKPEPEPEAKDGGAPPPKAEPSAQDKAPPATPPTPAVEIKAPASWKAEEKAVWAQVPPGAQKAIQRRELETARVLQESAEARKTTAALREVLHPFEPLLQQYGVRDPATEVIRPLLQTRAALELGTPEQKAQLVANMVYQFGVDIAKLDEFLVNMEKSGNKPQPISQLRAQPPAPSLRDNPELAPLFSMAERLKQAEQAKAQAAVAEISSHEHFEAVREDVADILEAAAARGKTVPLKQAFEAALRMNGLETASPAAASVSEAAAILAKSRNAAASVAGAPKSSPGQKPKTLRDTIVAAMNG